MSTSEVRFQAVSRKTLRLGWMKLGLASIQNGTDASSQRNVLTNVIPRRVPTIRPYQRIQSREEVYTKISKNAIAN